MLAILYELRRTAFPTSMRLLIFRLDNDKLVLERLQFEMAGVEEESVKDQTTGYLRLFSVSLK